MSAISADIASLAKVSTSSPSMSTPAPEDVTLAPPATEDTTTPAPEDVTLAPPATEDTTTPAPPATEDTTTPAPPATEDTTLPPPAPKPDVLFLYSYRAADATIIHSIAKKVKSCSRFSAQMIKGMTLEEVIKIVVDANISHVVVNCHASGLLNMMWGKRGGVRNTVQNQYLRVLKSPNGFITKLSEALKPHNRQVSLLMLQCHAGQWRIVKENHPQVKVFTIATDYSLHANTVHLVVDKIVDGAEVSDVFLEATKLKDEESSEYTARAYKFRTALHMCNDPHASQLASNQVKLIDPAFFEMFGDYSQVESDEE